MRHDVAPRIFIFAALLAEGRVLIERWKLIRISQHPFAVYAGDDKIVTITGIGKPAMAAAVAYVMAIFGNTRYPLLINLGIAGHRDREVGAIFCADKVVDLEVAKAFYPAILCHLPCATLAIKTVTKPCFTYSDAFLIDMEAAAFYEIAVKFSTCELIHCLKLVSDNAELPLDTVSQVRVEQWMAAQYATIEGAVSSLAGLRREALFEVVDDFELQLPFRLSVSNTLKLKSLLQRRRVLIGDLPLEVERARFVTATEFLAQLASEVDAMEFSL